MATVSLNITIDTKEKIEIGTITVENLQGSETINFEEEDDEDEYEEDEAGHMWDDEAYLFAASAFISWPDSWSAETLVGNLLMLGSDPSIEEQMKIQMWPPIMEYCVSRKINPFVYVEEQIACLADNFIRYKKS